MSKSKIVIIENNICKHKKEAMFSFDFLRKKKFNISLLVIKVLVISA